MKKSRNIKNLRDFPKNRMNCCLDNDLNKKIVYKCFKLLNLNKNLSLPNFSTLSRNPVSFTV
jgi:hypothetical protein